jgi:cytochrome P450
VHRCIGAAFAEMEMRVALVEIVRRRTLRAASQSAERVARRNVTFSPARGTRVIALPRPPAPARGYDGASAARAERLPS